MKNLPTLVLLSLTAPSVFADSFDENGIDLDNIAVRVLLNKGKEPKDKDGPAYCTPEDDAILSESFASVFSLKDRLQDQDDRALLWTADCNKLCKGYPRSLCYIVYSKCTLKRMLLEGNEEHEDEHIYHDEELEGHRFLESEASDKAIQKCFGLKNELEKEVIAIRKQLPSKLSEPCQNLVDMDISVTCALVGTEDTLF